RDRESVMYQSVEARNGIVSKVPTGMLIDGEWREAASGRRFDAFDPSTEQPIGSVPEGDAADVDAAVRAARRAFDEERWLGLGASERARILWRASDLIDQHRAELAALDGLNM